MCFELYYIKTEWQQRYLTILQWQFQHQPKRSDMIDRMHHLLSQTLISIQIHNANDPFSTSEHYFIIVYIKAECTAAQTFIRSSLVNTVCWLSSHTNCLTHILIFIGDLCARLYILFIYYGQLLLSYVKWTKLSQTTVKKII